MIAPFVMDVAALVIIGPIVLSVLLAFLSGIALESPAEMVGSLFYAPIYLIGLLIWHAIVRERARPINRASVRFFVRVAKATLILILPFVAIGARRIPGSVVAALLIVATGYALMRTLVIGGEARV